MLLLLLLLLLRLALARSLAGCSLQLDAAVIDSALPFLRRDLNASRLLVVGNVPTKVSTRQAQREEPLKRSKPSPRRQERAKERAKLGTPQRDARDCASRIFVSSSRA